MTQRVRRLLAGSLPAMAAAFASWGQAPDRLDFRIGGMGGSSEIRWDAGAQALSYRATDHMGRAEAWRRQPTPEQWTRFWLAVERLGVWGWKVDYGEAQHTDCMKWGLELAQGARRVRSTGCSMFPARGQWDAFQVEILQLRGGPEFVAERARALTKRLNDQPDTEARIGTVEELASLGPAAALAPVAPVAVPALIELAASAPPPVSYAAPGPEWLAVALGVKDQLDQADRATTQGQYGLAIRLCLEALKLDPQSERAGMCLKVARQATSSASRRLAEQARPETDSKRARLAVAASRALAAFGAAAVPHLTHSLKDSSPRRRVLTAEVLGGIGRAPRANNP